MAEFVIKGGKKLRGEIKVMGAKNSALKILPASMLFSGPLKVEKVPLIEDVFLMIDLLKNIGAEVKLTEERIIKINVAGQIGSDLKKALDIAYEAVSKISFEGMQYRKDIGKYLL